MHGLRLWALLVALCLALSGCQVTGEVENQAYVLVLAMDSSDGDGLTLTARVPRIGKGGGKDDKGGAGASPYLSFSVTASSWTRALDALQWATPRQINLSHIEMIVVSEALAAQQSFPALMRQVADTPHLYTNAFLVVCPGSAGAFLEVQETVIGTRLSSEIRAMMKQYAEQGFIPNACLADACYCADGIYGDPVAIWGYVVGEDAGDASVPTVTASPMKQRFCGTALFRRGMLIGTLSSPETRLLNLIRGQDGALPCEWQGTRVELTPEGPARRRVVLDGDAATLSVSLRLHAPYGLSDAGAEALEAALARDIERLIGACQRLECDPFGFAESAARHFASVPQWLSWDWRGHYARAATDVDIRITNK